MITDNYIYIIRLYIFLFAVYTQDVPWCMKFITRYRGKNKRFTCRHIFDVPSLSGLQRDERWDERSFTYHTLWEFPYQRYT